MLYGKASAAKLVGVSIRQLLRYAKQMEKERVNIGSRRRHLFSPEEIEEMKAMRSCRKS